MNKSALLKKGDLVQTWFNTGAFGYTIIYGEVVAAGPRRASIMWESGVVNRVAQADPGVEIARDQELAKGALARPHEHVKGRL